MAIKYKVNMLDYINKETNEKNGLMQNMQKRKEL